MAIASAAACGPRTVASITDDSKAEGQSLQYVVTLNHPSKTDTQVQVTLRDGTGEVALFPGDLPEKPETAFAKVACAMPPRFFTDYLSLLKVDGKWQVAQKIFATASAP